MMSNSRKQFVDIVAANDNSIDQLCWLAGECSIEHSDWTWEWRDGGKAAFKFKDELQMTNFRTKCLLLDQSNPGWAHKRLG